jgi:LPPG:FO 2-phospho-L-lactate transferase
MLAVKGLGRALASRRGRVTAISPLVAGKAVKGPLDSMIRNLGSGPANTTIADFYRRLAARLVVDRGDTPGRQKDGWPRILEYDVLIPTAARAARLARFTLGLD